jgi:hypothetical protein
VGVKGLGENFTGPWSLPTMLKRSRAMHLLGGIVAKLPFFGSSSSARLPECRRVPPWDVVLVISMFVGVDMVVIAPVQHETRLPYPGSRWRFGLTFFLCCFLLLVWVRVWCVCVVIFGVTSS